MSKISTGKEKRITNSQKVHVSGILGLVGCFTQMTFTQVNRDQVLCEANSLFFKQLDILCKTMIFPQPPSGFDAYILYM